ncbi:MAG: hypothetical protein A3H32_14505 [Betaproteobacteria bacterium RIFCSPLOWO2_02_FULL_63_19]|nr:MAG: hypothetical protein A3H32_14505 [Betaproteobacteria bacterium RIFCSPLOWO2_02_FULL_63_19]
MALQAAPRPCPSSPAVGWTIIVPTVRTRRQPILFGVWVVTPVGLFSLRLAVGHIVLRPIARSPVESRMPEMPGYGVEIGAVRKGHMRPPEPEFAG